MPTTTELTEDYLRKHNAIRDCLKKGIINYSRLARIIAKEIGSQKKTTKEAILIASRRYREKILKQLAYEDKIIEIVKASDIELRNRVAVVVLDKSAFPKQLLDLEQQAKKAHDIFYAIEGSSAITVITLEKYLREITGPFRASLLSVEKGLALVVLRSPKDIETTPGVVAYVYSLFAEHGINILDTLSCWTDTMFVVKEEDAANAMSFLRL